MAEVLTSAGSGLITGPAEQGRLRGRPLRPLVSESLLLCCCKILGDQLGLWDQWKQQAGWRYHWPKDILPLSPSASACGKDIPF